MSSEVIQPVTVFVVEHRSAESRDGPWGDWQPENGAHVAVGYQPHMSPGEGEPFEEVEDWDDDHHMTYVWRQKRVTAYVAQSRIAALEKELEGEREARRAERQRVIDTIRTHAADVTLFAKGRALDLMAWVLSLPDATTTGLACSRCGQPVSRSYEPGRCHADDCEPATMDEHDEAVTREEAFGSGFTPPTPPHPEVSRDERAGEKRCGFTIIGDARCRREAGHSGGCTITPVESADRAPVEFADRVTERKG